MRLGRRAIALAGLGAVAFATAAVGALRLADDESPARGDLIAYSCREPGNEWFAVCVVGPDGAGARQLTEGLPTSDPAWSPDGRTIVFTRHVDRGEYTTVAQDDLFLVSADGGTSRQLTRTHFGRSSGDAAWSPDGNRIAFVRGSAVVDAGVLFGAIFVANTDGSDVRRLTSGPRDTDPAWSPDGKEIAFARASGLPMKAEIRVLDVAAGASRG